MLDIFHAIFVRLFVFFFVIEMNSAQWSANDIFPHHITSGRDAETE